MPVGVNRGGRDEGKLGRITTSERRRPMMVSCGGGAAAVRVGVAVVERAAAAGAGETGFELWVVAEETKAADASASAQGHFALRALSLTHTQISVG